MHRPVATHMAPGSLLGAPARQPHSLGGSGQQGPDWGSPASRYSSRRGPPRVPDRQGPPGLLSSAQWWPLWSDKRGVTQRPSGKLTSQEPSRSSMQPKRCWWLAVGSGELHAVGKRVGQLRTLLGSFYKYQRGTKPGWGCSPHRLRGSGRERLGGVPVGDLSAREA